MVSLAIEADSGFKKQAITRSGTNLCVGSFIGNEEHSHDDTLYHWHRGRVSDGGSSNRSTLSSHSDHPGKRASHLRRADQTRIAPINGGDELRDLARYPRCPYSMAGDESSTGTLGGRGRASTHQCRHPSERLVAKGDEIAL